LQVLSMYLFAARGAYFADDLMFISMARVDFHLRPGLRYLTDPVFGHFTPGLRFMYWLAAVTQMTYTSGLVFNLLFCPLILLLMYRLLGLLFGHTWKILPLLSVFAFSAVWMPETMWWTAGAHAFPTMILGLLMIDGFFRWVFTGRRRWLVTSVLAFSVALLWHEKAMMLVLLLPLTAGMVLADGPSPISVLRAILLRYRAWLLYAIPAGLYLYHYFFQGAYQPQPPPTAGGMVTLLGLAWAQAFIPAMFGGPLAWHFSRIGLGAAGTPPWAMVLAQLAFVALVIASVRLHGARAWRAWALPIVAVLLYAGVAGFARVAVFGPGVGTDYRYLFDAAIFMTLGLGLAFLPLAQGPGDLPEQAAGHPRRHAVPGSPRLALAGCAVCLAGFLVSMTDASNHWADGAPGSFSRNLVATIKTARPEADGHPLLFNTVAPDGVVPSSFYPYNKASYFLPILVHGATAGHGPVPRYMIAADGTVHAARIGGGASATALSWNSAATAAGSPQSCAPAAPAPSSSEFQLDHPLPSRQWFLLLKYTNAHNARVHLALNTGQGDDIDATGNFDTQHLPDGDGQYAIDFRVEPVTSVRLDLDPDSSVCLAALEVGRPVPTS
jgi:hypothetical protein